MDFVWGYFDIVSFLIVWKWGCLFFFVFGFIKLDFFILGEYVICRIVFKFYLGYLNGLVVVFSFIL